GSLVGVVALATDTVFAATMNWFKPPVAKDKFYPDGFNTTIPSTGAVLIATSKGGPSVAGSGTLTLGAGNLQSNLVKSVMIDSTGVVTVAPAGDDALTMAVDPSDGFFSGTFQSTDLRRTVPFSGLMIRTNNF